MSERSEAMTELRAGEGRCPACAKPRADLSAPCPHCGAPPLGAGELAAAGAANRRDSAGPGMQVRAADLEPYVGLRYVAKLFRFMALILVLVLIFEIVAGL